MPTTELTDPRPQDLAAHLRRLLADLSPILETDPYRVLTRARQAAKRILADLYRQEHAGIDVEGLGFNDLFGRLVARERLPRRIQIQLQAIDSFGTGEEHSDSGLSRGDVLPCLQALDTLVRWYVKDYLGSSADLDFLPEIGTGTGSRGPAPARPASRRRRKPAWRRLVRRRHPGLWGLVDLLLSLAVVAVFVLQLRETQVAAGRRIGFVFEDRAAGVEITGLRPEGPAERDGMKVGDLLVEVAGQAIAHTSEYDVPAAGFTRGEAVAFRVLRDRRAVDLAITPGVPVDWMQPAIRGFVMSCCLVLAALTLYRSAGDLRGRLLGIFLFLLALELAAPELIIGEARLGFLLVLFGYLHTGTQIAIELHLASMIPERRRWLVRRGWMVPVFYAASVGWGVAAAATFAHESLYGPGLLPWSTQHFDDFLYFVGLPMWATAIVGLLAIPAWTYPERQGRQQARLVLLGFLPWSLYVYLSSVMEAFGSTLPEWTDPFFPFLILPFPLSIWAMMELESRAHRKILLTLAQEIRRCDTLEDVARQIAGDLYATFHPTRTYVFFRRERDDELTLGHASGAAATAGDLPRSSELLRIVGESDEALLYPDDLESLACAEERAWIERLQARVILPLNDSRRGLVGLVALGDKRSEERYSDRDFKLLHALAGQIALSLENLDLQSRLHEKTRVQREILTRLQERNVNLVKECPACGACYDSAAQTCGDPACRASGTELALSVPVERTIGERYRLDRMIGKGGIGAVYEALDLRLNRRVAVKVLLGAVLDKPHVQLRFEREARVIAQLSHPNIVTLYDFGQTEVGNAFIVLELLRGTSLRSVLKSSGAIAPARIAAWLEPALEGLKAAHRKGVIHRDLKPGNVFIARESRGGKRVKLLDFGIAKIKSSGAETGNLTVPGVVLGTLGYMAPEQTFGGDVDERSDVYSLGVLVTEALLGRRPFKGRTPIEVLASVAGGSFGLPADTPAAVELGKIVARCLEHEPGDRWRSVAELQEVLIPALRACPPPPGAGPPQPGEGGPAPAAEASTADTEVCPVPGRIPDFTEEI